MIAITSVLAFGLVAAWYGRARDRLKGLVAACCVRIRDRLQVCWNNSEVLVLIRQGGGCAHAWALLLTLLYQLYVSIGAKGVGCRGRAE